MKATVSIGSRIRKFVSKTILLVLVCLLGSCLYLATVGFPSWLLKESQKQLSKGDFAINAAAMKLDFLRGIVVKDACIYRKYVVGPAAVEAEEIVVAFSIEDMLTGKSLIRKVSLTNGEVRPKMVHSPVAKEQPDIPIDILVDLRGFFMQGLDIEQLAFHVDSDGSVTRYDDIQGRIGAGKMCGAVSGRIQFDANTLVLEGHLNSEFDLHAVIPVLKSMDFPTVIDVLERFDFSALNPRCEFNVRQVFTENPEFNMAGRFWMAEGSYRGVDVLRADGKIGIEFSKTNILINVDELFVVRQDGIVQGEFSILPNDEIVYFDIASTIDPKAFSQMTRILTNQLQTLCKFNGPARIDAKGAAGYEDMKKVDFEITVDCRNVDVGPVSLDHCFFKSKMLGLTNTITDIRGSLYGGTFGGNAELVLPDDVVTNLRYKVAAHADDIDFAKFIDDVMKDQDKEYSGKMWAKIDVAGLAGPSWAKTAAGKGAMGVKNGRVFMLPIFGGFSSLMVKIIPGLDFVLRQGDLKADFAIADGKVHSNKIQIEGDVLSLQGKGDLYTDRRVDYDIQVKLMKGHTLVGKLMRGITYVISKFLEFNLSGTLDKPQWSMNTMNLAPALLKKLGLTRDKAPMVDE
ncbi:MAG: hypothetical protein KAH23_03470 [Kiritimatiellae bacterium]|nr:hypothetical protein [Kiritimatiellia bacterium]